MNILEKIMLSKIMDEKIKIKIMLLSGLIAYFETENISPEEIAKILNISIEFVPILLDKANNFHENILNESLYYFKTAYEKIPIEYLTRIIILAKEKGIEIKWSEQ